MGLYPFKRGFVGDIRTGSDVLARVGGAGFEMALVGFKVNTGSTILF